MTNTKFRNEQGRFRAPTAAEKVDIRKDQDKEQQKEDIERLEAMFKSGAPTFVLIYADWCGHCKDYLPTWSKWEDAPGRSANMAKVHFDMQKSVPKVDSATINGYPTVIKVLPDGKIQPYPSQGGATNAVPFMREEAEMEQELGINSSQQGGQQGGVLGAFTTAIQKAGPAALLLLATSAVRKVRARTYKAPKRASARASTRRSRLSRQSRRLRRLRSA